MTTKAPKLKKKIPVLTDVITKGNRAKEYHSQNAPSSADLPAAAEHSLDREALEALIKPIVDKKLSVYTKLLSAELTRDIAKKLETALQEQGTDSSHQD